MNKTINDAVAALQAKDFSVEILEDVAVVTNEEVPGFSAYVSTDDEGSEVVCTTRIFGEADLSPETKVEALETMLSSSVMVPLSSIGKVGDNYELFGQLGGGDSEAVVKEVETLFDNIPEVMEVMKPYFVQ